MKTAKETVLKTATTTQDPTATLAKNSRGLRPMKSMIGLKSFRPRTAQVATAGMIKTEMTTEAR